MQNYLRIHDFSNLSRYDGVALRNTNLSSETLACLSYNSTISVSALVNADSGQGVDVGMSATPDGFEQVYTDRPYQLVILSRSSRWITPGKLDVVHENEAEVLWLESMNIAFRVGQSTRRGEKTYYYLEEV